MVDRPSILCPVDFSDASRGALRLAVDIAEHFYAAFTVLAVNDPLLAHGATLAYGEGWLDRDVRRLLDEFVAKSLEGRPPAVAECHREIATGKPAREILRIAQSRRADLIVMGAHGLTGPRKWLLGSTTERVLRGTDIPVLVIPASAVIPRELESLRDRVRCVLAPVDLSAATPHQVRVAGGLAKALDAALVLAHVVEPIVSRAGHERLMSRLRAERHANSRRTLGDLTSLLPTDVRASVMTAGGEPAAEIARLAHLVEAGVIVMGLHGAVGTGPRMGSVTYRVLCQSDAMVLALPPRLEAEAVTPLGAAVRRMALVD
jgi:nucleotide-binding universal stress UspA family protein